MTEGCDQRNDNGTTTANAAVDDDAMGDATRTRRGRGRDCW
jgi:hypothetical protein